KPLPARCLERTAVPEPQAPAAVQVANLRNGDSMKKTNEPILLSGLTFTGGLLSSDRPDLSVPVKPLSGDLKLVAVNSERAGKSARARLQHYTGFFSAFVYDGKRWRKFNLRAGAAVVATYVSNGDRKDKLEKALSHLRTLRGRTSVWGQEGYEVRALPATSRSIGISTSSGDTSPAPVPPTGGGTVSGGRMQAPERKTTRRRRGK